MGRTPGSARDPLVALCLYQKERYSVARLSAYFAQPPHEFFDN
jgi:hypothetical protein